MKKIITFICLALVLGSATSQDLKTKKGFPILPEPKDWAISVDATPFLVYIGGLFGGAAPTAGVLKNSPISLTGKYFLNEKTAFRVKFRVGFYSNSDKNDVVKDETPVPATPDYVQDKWVTHSSDFLFGLGIEKRRGKTRLQGFYGADALVGFGGSGNKFTYGNAFSSTNTTPMSTDYPWTAGTPGYTSSPTSSRVLDINNGVYFQVGARCFIGAEYFVLPKLSLGFELGYGLSIYKTSKGSQTIESWNSSSSSATQTTVDVAGRSTTSLDIENMWSGNAIIATFHF